MFPLMGIFFSFCSHLQGSRFVNGNANGSNTASKDLLWSNKPLKLFDELNLRGYKVSRIEKPSRLKKQQSLRIQKTILFYCILMYYNLFKKKYCVHAFEFLFLPFLLILFNILPYSVKDSFILNYTFEDDFFLRSSTIIQVVFH